MLGFEITSVQNLGDYRLALVFADGRAGQVDLRSYIQKAGVFTRFADMQYFNSVYLVYRLKLYFSFEFGIHFIRTHPQPAFMKNLLIFQPASRVTAASLLLAFPP